MSWPSPCGPHPAFSVGLDPYQPTCATAGKCLKVNQKQQNNRYHKRCQNDSFRSCGHLVPVTKPGASLFARWQRVTAPGSPLGLWQFLWLLEGACVCPWLSTSTLACKHAAPCSWGPHHSDANPTWTLESLGYGVTCSAPAVLGHSEMGSW